MSITDIMYPVFPSVSSHTTPTNTTYESFSSLTLSLFLKSLSIHLKNLRLARRLCWCLLNMLLVRTGPMMGLLALPLWPDTHTLCCPGLELSCSLSCSFRRKVGSTVGESRVGRSTLWCRGSTRERHSTEWGGSLKVAHTKLGRTSLGCSLCGHLCREAWTGTRGPSWSCSLGRVGVTRNLGQHLPCRRWWLDNGYRRGQTTIPRRNK